MSDNEAPRPPDDELVLTTHEVRCRPLAGRPVKLLVTDHVAVIKIDLKSTDLEAGELAINFRDVLSLNDTILRASQALTGLTPPSRPTLEVVEAFNRGRSSAQYDAGREPAFSRGALVVEGASESIAQFRHRHWFWPFGEKGLWTRPG